MPGPVAYDRHNEGVHDERDFIQNLNLLKPYSRKRRSFEHEREVRALVLRIPDFSNSDWKPVIDNGISIPIDIEKLVLEIYVSPTSPPWFYELVRSVVKKYGYTFPVVQSDLIRNPLF